MHERDGLALGGVVVEHDGLPDELDARSRDGDRTRPGALQVGAAWHRPRGEAGGRGRVRDDLSDTEDATDAGRGLDVACCTVSVRLLVSPGRA